MTSGYSKFRLCPSSDPNDLPPPPPPQKWAKEYSAAARTFTKFLKVCETTKHGLYRMLQCRTVG